MAEDTHLSAVEDVARELQSLALFPPSPRPHPQDPLVSVLSQLSLHDLTKCARVSCSWNIGLAPYIWKSINIDTPKKLDRFLTAEAQQALARYADNVQDLHLRYPELLDLFVPSEDTTTTCTKIRWLEIVFPLKAKAHQAITLVRNNRSLKSLTVHAFQEDKTMMGLVHASGPNLQELEFSYRASPTVTKYLLDNLPKNIARVRLTISRHTRYQATRSAIPRRRYDSLKSLKIDGDFDGVEEYVLLPFLYGCPGLREFETPKTGCYRNKAVRAALTRLGLPLKELTNKDLPEDAEDKEVAEAIASYRGLKSIRLDHYYTAGHHTAVAIAKNSGTLESLEIQGCVHLSIRGMKTIMTSAYNLKTLKAIDLGSVYEGTDPWIWSCYISQFGCAATSLEVFHCVINVPRPETQVPVEHRDFMYASAIDQSGVSLLCQEAVYRMLGRQTNLRELRLGYENVLVNSSRKESYFQWYCVEMTLETGLHHMQSLKELRLLDVSHMHHGIGVAELEWIQTNWKLEQLIGIFDNGKDRDPAIEEWVELHHAAWVIL
ncbi:hypothetical protein BGZ82_001921 [Podila clonocystis]|nr:hypothetical protein BGZ82_001921 [Podila clonocystis]